MIRKGPQKVYQKSECVLLNQLVAMKLTLTTVKYLMERLERQESIDQVEESHQSIH